MTKRLLLIVALFCAQFVAAQTVTPLVQPHASFVDTNGSPCVGCQLFTYAAGTSTPQATYKDSTGLSVNLNPVILDITGSADIWLSPVAYKFVLKDADGVTIWTADQVQGLGVPVFPAVNGDPFGTITKRWDGFFTDINASGTVTAAAFVGNLTGDVTGNLTGNVTGNLTGNVTSAGTSTFNILNVTGHFTGPIVNSTVDSSPIGATTPSTGAFTTLAASTSITGPITGSTINSTTIGATTPSTGVFTGLKLSGAIGNKPLGTDASGNIVETTGAFSYSAGTSGYVQFGTVLFQWNTGTTDTTSGGETQTVSFSQPCTTAVDNVMTAVINPSDNITMTYDVIATAINIGGHATVTLQRSHRGDNGPRTTTPNVFLVCH